MDRTAWKLSRDQQQPVLCQQVLNRPPAVIWLQGREAAPNG